VEIRTKAGTGKCDRMHRLCGDRDEKARDRHSADCDEQHYRLQHVRERPRLAASRVPSLRPRPSRPASPS
jgi:hypothetical protein